MALARRNHFVPQWYQRRFLTAAGDRFYYLDLKPDTVVSPGGTSYQRRALLRWGPQRCFYTDDLYTLKLGRWGSDIVERQFFGPLDARGERAVPFFIDYAINNDTEKNLHALMNHMSAQRLRTPRGLDFLRRLTNVNDHNLVLTVMRSLFQLHGTMWMEGVWEVVRARQSPTKFIISDEPVTFYNSRVFPASPSLVYPMDADLAEVGTRTIYPLGSDACLIISHLEFLRGPNRNPRRHRTNARSFQPAMFDMRSIQTGRELEEDEVRRINYVIKQRATRRIAAAEEEWLHPEQLLSTTHWSKLDHDWFLFPNLYCVQFSGTFVVGYKGGGSWVVDEYGRTPRHPDFENKGQHDREWNSWKEAQLEWAIKRESKSRGRDHDRWGDASEAIMMDALERHRAERAKKGKRGSRSRE